MLCKKCGYEISNNSHINSINSAHTLVCINCVEHIDYNLSELLEISCYDYSKACEICIQELCELLEYNNYINFRLDIDNNSIPDSFINNVFNYLIDKYNKNNLSQRISIHFDNTNDIIIDKLNSMMK